MKRVLAATTTAFAIGILAFSSSASAGGNLQLRVGGFAPRADSNLFADDTSLYQTDIDRPVKKSDWSGVMGGIEYSHTLDRNLELGFHMDGFSKSVDTSYRDYTRSDNGEIFQTLSLSEVPIGVTLRLIGGSRHSTVRPYIGIGPDVVFWQYKERGSFIDFTDSTFPIVDDRFRSEGAALGGHVAVGLRLALSRDTGLTAEGRYLAAAKADMGDDFHGNKIDLNGASATVGFYVNF
jgi:outer membrane protein W